MNSQTPQASQAPKPTPPKPSKIAHPKILEADRDNNGDFLSEEQETLIRAWLKQQPLDPGTNRIASQKKNKNTDLKILEDVPATAPATGTVKKERTFRLQYSILIDESGAAYALYKGKESKVDAERKLALGTGAYATVKIGRLIKMNEKEAFEDKNQGKVNLVAVKISLIELKVDMKIFAREADVIEKIEQKGKRRLYVDKRINQAASNPEIKGKGYIIMELGKRSLVNYLNTCYCFETRLALAISCLKNVKFFHDKDLLHRDIKADNFIYNEDAKHKTESTTLIDFGMIIDLKRAKEIDKTKNRTGNIRTEFGLDFYHSKRFRWTEKFPLWSPEARSSIMGNWFSKSSDMYAIGELMDGNYGMKLSFILEHYAPIPEDAKKIIQTEIKALSDLMKHVNPHKRPSIEEGIFALTKIMEIYIALKNKQPLDKLQAELAAMRKSINDRFNIYLPEMIDAFKNPFTKIAYEARMEECLKKNKADIENNPYLIMSALIALESVPASDSSHEPVIISVIQSLLTHHAPYDASNPEILKKILRFPVLVKLYAEHIISRSKTKNDEFSNQKGFLLYIVRENKMLTDALTCSGVTLTAEEIFQLITSKDLSKAVMGSNCLSFIDIGKKIKSEINHSVMDLLNKSLILFIPLFKKLLEKDGPWTIAPSPIHLMTAFISPLNPEMRWMVINHLSKSFHEYSLVDQNKLVQTVINHPAPEKVKEELFEIFFKSPRGLDVLKNHWASFLEKMPAMASKIILVPTYKLFDNTLSHAYKEISEAIKTCHNKNLQDLWSQQVKAKIIKPPLVPKKATGVSSNPLLTPSKSSVDSSKPLLKRPPLFTKMPIMGKSTPTPAYRIQSLSENSSTDAKPSSASHKKQNS